MIFDDGLTRNDYIEGDALDKRGTLRNGLVVMQLRDGFFYTLLTSIRYSSGLPFKPIMPNGISHHFVLN